MKSPKNRNNLQVPASVNLDELPRAIGAHGRPSIGVKMPAILNNPRSAAPIAAMKRLHVLRLMHTKITVTSNVWTITQTLAGPEAAGKELARIVRQP